MALTTCVKCGAAPLELKEISPRGSNYKLQAIQCAACGAAIGVVESLNAGIGIESLKRELGELKAETHTLKGMLAHIDMNLTNLINGSR